MSKLLVKSMIKLYITVVCCCFGLLSACSSTSSIGTDPDEHGSMHFAIRLSKLAAATIVRAEAVVSADDFTQITEELSVSGDVVIGLIPGIPAGSDRSFTINAYDVSGNLIYTGSVTIDVIAGQQVTARVTLRSVGSSGVAPTPILRVVGTPTLVRGDNYSSLGWSPSDFGSDARVTGEIKNEGTADAVDVVIDVTLRDNSGNLVARVNNHSVGTIRIGDSAVFTVIVEGIFASYDSPDPVVEVTFE